MRNRVAPATLSDVRITRAMQALGYLLYGLAGLAPVLDPTVHFRRHLLWVTAYVVFGVAFHIGASAPNDEAHRTRRLFALVAQVPAMLAMAALMPCHFGALTLVIVASQAALDLTARETVLWILAQTLGVA